MSQHLTSDILSSLVDGELPVAQSDEVTQHLGQCPTCTSAALQHSLMKSATAKAGHRFAVPPEVEQRLRREAQPESPAKARRTRPRPGWGMAAIAVLVLACAALILVQRHMRLSQLAAAQQSSLITEVCDLHISTLAANQAPQVISSDRHTVKPWFQGKLPFSFNLPENLPANMRLDGANLTYIDDRPVAQLLYSIGRHHVSVFLGQSRLYGVASAERQGFHVIEFRAAHLEGIAVSDVEPGALADLARAVQDAQTPR